MPLAGVSGEKGTRMVAFQSTSCGSRQRALASRASSHEPLSEVQEERSSSGRGWPWPVSSSGVLGECRRAMPSHPRGARDEPSSPPSSPRPSSPSLPPDRREKRERLAERETPPSPEKPPHLHRQPRHQGRG